MSVFSPARLAGSLAGDAAKHISARAAAREAELFGQALRNSSNLELDWLWLFMQCDDPGRRRYCLERALAINPASAIARRELALMER